MRPTDGPVAAARLHATFNNVVSFPRKLETTDSCLVDTTNKIRANLMRCDKPMKKKTIT